MNFTKFYFILLLLFPFFSFSQTTPLENNKDKQTARIENKDESTESIQPKQQETAVSTNTDNSNSKNLSTISKKKENAKPKIKAKTVRKIPKKQQQKPASTTANSTISEEKPPNDLNSIFERMVSSSNNYNSPKGIVYKVIPTNKISSFWEQTKDTLNVNSETIKKQKKEVNNLQLKIEGLNLTISKKEENIKSSQIQNSLIYVFGAPLSKFTFKTLFFTIISILTILLLYLVYLYKNSHLVTKEAVKDKKEIEALLSLEKQKRSDDIHKLKRELQTERNLVIELKNKG